MHVLITTLLNKPSTKVKGLTTLSPAAGHVHTTRLEVQWDKEHRAMPELMDKSAGDIRALSLEGAPLVECTAIVEGVRSLGRLLKRSRGAWKFYGFLIESRIDYGDIHGQFTIRPVLPMYGNDLPFLLESLRRYINRGMGVVRTARSPWGYYHLLQAMGIPHDIKLGLEEAEVLKEWWDIRYLANGNTIEDRRLAWKRKDYQRKKGRVSTNPPLWYAE